MRFFWPDTNIKVIFKLICYLELYQFHDPHEAFFFVFFNQKSPNNLILIKPIKQHNCRTARSTFIAQTVIIIIVGVTTLFLVTNIFYCRKLNL